MFSTALVLIAMITTSAVESHSEEPEQVTDLPLWSGSWAPPLARPEGRDWIRLSSQEWVNGEILLMRNFDLQFDSDEFGVVEIEWEDVDEIWAERSYTLVLEEVRTTHTGTFTLRGGRFAVRTLNGIETIDRDEVIAIVPDSSKELGLWSVRASAGATLRSGNTDSTDLNGKLKLNREDENTSYDFEYSGVYGSLDNEKNTNTHRGLTSLDVFLTRNLFLVPGAFEVFSDEFQNISYRLTSVMGIGYYLVREPRLEWQAIFGLGYQYTRIDSAPAGAGKASDNGAAILSTSVDAELNSRLDLILGYQIQVIAPDTDLTNHHAEATLEIELTSAIDLDLNFVWDRIERPDQQTDGRRPDTDDFRTTVGIAIEY